MQHHVFHVSDSSIELSWQKGALSIPAGLKTEASPSTLFFWFPSLLSSATHRSINQSINQYLQTDKLADLAWCYFSAQASAACRKPSELAHSLWRRGYYCGSAASARGGFWEEQQEALVQRAVLPELCSPWAGEQAPARGSAPSCALRFLLAPNKVNRSVFFRFSLRLLSLSSSREGGRSNSHASSASLRICRF